MKKIIILLIFNLFFISCNSAFSIYNELNNDVLRGKLYHENKKIVKPLLAKENENVILIITWYNTVNSKITRFDALLYSYENNEIKFVENSNENPYEFKIRNRIEEYSDKNLNFILQKYLSGDEKYLLDIISPYSGVNYPYWLYDLKNRKRLKIQEFVLSDDGTRVKELFEDDGWE